MADKSAPQAASGPEEVNHSDVPPSAASNAATTSDVGASAAGPSAITNTATGETGGSEARKSKKKTRLMWDEENLQLNALEMERHPKMKIDEPKTPFERGPGSEAGSSTSGSAPGSPAPYFIPKERLRGFDALEATNISGSGDVGNSLRRSVQIVDARDAAPNGSPSGSNDEFIAKRRKHYANEARLMRAEAEEDRAQNAPDNEEPLDPSVYNAPQPEAITSENHVSLANGDVNDDADPNAAQPNGHGVANSINNSVPNGTG